MSDSEIKAGTVVWLKSGGPRMTVEFIERDQATCTWFDKAHSVKQSTFPLSNLTASQPLDI